MKDEDVADNAVDKWRFAVKTFPMLYRDANSPCHRSCMCYGWEMGHGLYDRMTELSAELETLNLLFYPKYGVRVVLEQCKTKFGRLRVYFRTETETPLLLRIWHIPFERMSGWIRRHVDFGFKCVTDDEGGVKYTATEIPEDEVDSTKADAERFPNMSVGKIGGTWYSITRTNIVPTRHFEPTRHKFLYRIECLLNRLDRMLFFTKSPSSKQTAVAMAMERIADRIIRKAEEDCYGICEKCGTQIGTEHSPRIETKGWISYVCECCDAKDRMAVAKSNVDWHLKKLSESETSDETKEKINKIRTEAAEIYGIAGRDGYVSTEELLSAAKRMEELYASTEDFCK